MLNFIIFFLTLFEFRFSFLYILMILFCFFFFMIVSLFFVFVVSVFFSKFFHTSPLILVQSSLHLTDCNILCILESFLPHKVYAFCILYMKTFPLQKFFATKKRVILNQFNFTFFPCSFDIDTM